MRDLLVAISDCADPWLLRERIAGDPKFSKLCGGLMPKPVTQRYALIELRQDLFMPGLPGGRDKMRLENVDGRPHAGGIDVVCVKDNTVVTVPWDVIRRAVRTLDSDE
jgi:hypothetical protein